MSERITRDQYRANAAKRPPVRVDYKSILLSQIALLGLPEPVPEYQFTPHRRWRLDWAYIEQKIGIEYQGGNYTGKGGHNTISGMAGDYEKLSGAAMLGWCVFLVDSATVRNGRAAQWIATALKLRSGNVAEDDVRAVIAKPVKAKKRRAKHRIATS